MRISTHPAPVVIEMPRHFSSFSTFLVALLPSFLLHRSAERTRSDAFIAPIRRETHRGVVNYACSISYPIGFADDFEVVYKYFGSLCRRIRIWDAMSFVRCPSTSREEFINFKLSRQFLESRLL